MKNNERRVFSLKVEIRAAEGEGKSPIIRGHAAVFNSLSDNLGGFREQILPGAFSDAIKNSDVRALFNHNPDLVLGRSKAGTLRLAEDNIGLGIEIDPPDTQLGRDLTVSLQRGDIDQMSFGFSVMDGDDAWDLDSAGNVVRTIKRVARLYDVSPVTYPAYPETDCAMRSLENFKRTLDTHSKDFQETLAAYARINNLKFGPLPKN